MAPQDVHTLIPQTWESLPSRQEGLCRRDEIKDFELETGSCIILVMTRVPIGERGRQERQSGREGRMPSLLALKMEEGMVRRGYEQLRGAGKGLQTGSPQSVQKKSSPEDTLILS